MEYVEDSGLLSDTDVEVEGVDEYEAAGVELSVLLVPRLGDAVIVAFLVEVDEGDRRESVTDTGPRDVVGVVDGVIVKEGSGERVTVPDKLLEGDSETVLEGDDVMDGEREYISSERDSDTDHDWLSLDVTDATSVVDAVEEDEVLTLGVSVTTDEADNVGLGVFVAEGDRESVALTVSLVEGLALTWSDSDALGDTLSESDLVDDSDMDDVTSFDGLFPVAVGLPEILNVKEVEGVSVAESESELLLSTVRVTVPDVESDVGAVLLGVTVAVASLFVISSVGEGERLIDTVREDERLPIDLDMVILDASLGVADIVGEFTERVGESRLTVAVGETDSVGVRDAVTDALASREETDNDPVPVSVTEYLLCDHSFDRETDPDDSDVNELCETDSDMDDASERDIVNDVSGVADNVKDGDFETLGVIDGVGDELAVGDEDVSKLGEAVSVRPVSEIVGVTLIISDALVVSDGEPVMVADHDASSVGVVDGVRLLAVLVVDGSPMVYVVDSDSSAVAVANVGDSVMLCVEE
jgi:hypothetical protein